ncbi:MAG: N-acetyltransferase [Kordiimonadaceae bacterium]|jgi:putative acetyltransferase|nr:N-acetyltransferase [Kordiimonadaceae bacterium]MBT6037599.1 N-acetyltransferase [Kordiimonadaceae bacterium]MBT6329756.1 N-acetyltransferase [Kordiimonadaceae bacterium]MBT7581538.1 N-acetyltransferase [Kordiimonadaceae bacterium]
MNIRFEEQKDINAVRDVHLDAFEGPGEAKLVDMLREKASPIVSLVAKNEGEVVGHIMFSPVMLGDYDIKIMGLAPVTVLESEQNKGYGAALVNAGLEECKALGYQGVVLLGHAEYYPRFGFRTSTEYSITCEYDVPSEYFMALELVEGAFDDVSGTIKYHPVFAEL